MHGDSIVITGCGAVGCFGTGTAALWSALQEERPLYRVSDRFGRPERCASVNGLNLRRYRWGGRLQRAPLISQYAMAAADEAIQQSGLHRRDVDRDGVAIVYGTSFGPNAVMEANMYAIIRQGMGGIEPLKFQESVFNAPASRVSIEYRFRGPVTALPMGMASGGYALAMAADMITFGQADVALVLVADEMSDISRRALRLLRLMARDTETEYIVKPFDRRRQGASDGEGAAAIVLERRSHAEARGVKPLALLAGWSAAADRFGCGGKRNGVSLSQAMEQALDMAGSDGNAAAVFAGSACSMDMDRAEAEAMVRIFGAPENQPLITNIRGTLGDAKSASGLFSVIAAIRSIEEGRVPATRGCEEPDPRCQVNVAFEASDIDDSLPLLVNFLWINGVNASVALRAVDGAQEVRQP